MGNVLKLDGCCNKDMEIIVNNDDYEKQYILEETTLIEDKLEKKSIAFLKKSQQIKNSIQDDEAVNINDFNILKVIGKGQFATVFLVQKKDNQEIYALKALNKQFIAKNKQQRNTWNERLILEKMNNPFMVSLHYAFQSEEKLFFALDFMQGGELFFHLKQNKRFNEERAKFYAAEIVLALEYLHYNNVIYRDLKPENILVDIDGHIKITDFGLSKCMKESLTYSFAGSPHYIAPEILKGVGYNKTADWWTLGILIYEMISGTLPYKSKGRKELYDEILEVIIVLIKFQVNQKKIQMKPSFSKDVVSILRKLLEIDPRLRLGSKGSSEIKKHPFFKEINWKKMFHKQVEPPFKPKITKQTDLRHFDPYFLKMSIDEEMKPDVKPNFLKKKLNINNYEGFDYINKATCHHEHDHTHQQIEPNSQENCCCDNQQETIVQEKIIEQCKMHDECYIDNPNFELENGKNENKNCDQTNSSTTQKQ